MSSVVSTEKNILQACMQWLNTVPGLKIWRQNTGIKSGEHTNRQGHTKRFFVRYGEKGQCDIGGIMAPYGVRIEIEIKRPGLSPTPDQAEWIRFIQQSGGIAFWCDSLRSCVEQLRKEFQARGWAWLASWEVW